MTSTQPRQDEFMSAMGAAAETPVSGERSRIRTLYGATRRLSLTLAGHLAPEDMVVQSMPDASPTKWHLAHTTWFFSTFVLARYGRNWTTPHPLYEYLFNSYYNAVGPQFPRPARGILSRPTVDEICDYRRLVDEAVETLIKQADDETAAAFLPIIELGIHHEQQHQELLLTDIKHALARNPLGVGPFPETPQPRANGAPALRFIPFESGLCEIGHDAARNPRAFVFDHECPRHRIFLEPYALANRPVTNGEFANFIQDRGYETPTLWLSDGWAFIQNEGIEAPLYWRKKDGQWWHYTLHGERPVDPECPVAHISYFEADAFARWADARLPREAEIERAAQDEPIEGHFLTVGALEPFCARQGDGLLQHFGDVWEWTQSAFAAYPGYKPLADALGEYNGKFMCNQFVLRGGSAYTPPGHMRATYRNFFPPNARWQLAGVRLAKDI